MNTPVNEIYEGMTRPELFTQLGVVEREISLLATQMAELSFLDIIAQEHREAIQRALGCFVLKDKREET